MYLDIIYIAQCQYRELYHILLSEIRSKGTNLPIALPIKRGFYADARQELFETIAALISESLLQLPETTEISSVSFHTRKSSISWMLKGILEFIASDWTTWNWWLYRCIQCNWKAWCHREQKVCYAHLLKSHCNIIIIYEVGTVTQQNRIFSKPRLNEKICPIVQI